MHVFFAQVIGQAFKAKAFTVDSLQAAFVTAGLQHTSRGHVYALCGGQRAPTAEELNVALDHMGFDRFADAAAASTGTVTVRPGMTHVQFDHAVVAAHINASASLVVVRTLDATSPTSEGGSSVTASEHAALARQLTDLSATASEAAARHQAAATQGPQR